MSTPVVHHTPGAQVRRRLRQVVLILAAAALIGAAAMIGGAAINDAKIASNPGRSLATVTGVGALRTTVEYQDQNGRYQSPPQGLLYPSGLGPGQQVWVTYARDEPDLVKVEGREWTLSIIPALSVALISLLIAWLGWVGADRIALRVSRKFLAKGDLRFTRSFS